MTNEWTKPDHAAAYLARKSDIPHRHEGEATLLSEVPSTAQRVLDRVAQIGKLIDDARVLPVPRNGH